MPFDLTDCFSTDRKPTTLSKYTANAKREDLLIAMAREGKTYKEMGTAFCIKRQRVKQILDRLRNTGFDVPLPMHVRQEQRKKNLVVTALNRNSADAKKAVSEGADPRVVAALIDYLRKKKANAKRSGVPFDITFADVWPIPETCPALGIPISLFAPHRDNAVSFDQIQPGRGYTKDNVVVVSYRANRIKNDATPKELRAIAAFFSDLTSE